MSEKRLNRLSVFIGGGKLGIEEGNVQVARVVVLLRDGLRGNERRRIMIDTCIVPSKDVSPIVHATSAETCWRGDGQWCQWRRAGNRLVVDIPQLFGECGDEYQH